MTAARLPLAEAVVPPSESGETGETVENAAASRDDVVARAQRGDVDAFETVYKMHVPAVYLLCRRMLGDEREARELVQDVFVRAWERLTTFKGQSSFATWLHRLAVNVVLEHLRRTKRDAARLTGDDAFAEFHGHGINSDARLDLDSALARLPDGARHVFVLHDIHGYSHDEIAELTGIAAGTARAQLFRARRALMRILE
jgi:RNA polymerase sigma-70 factor (ECF subfamily)